ncbi:MAG: asparaginase [Negativicutes bacterium]|nr:asparaginase [Negativicutes bacterium]
MKKNIVVLATGGTIAGKADTPNETGMYQAAVLTVEELLDAIPRLKELANITGEQIAQIDSANMSQTIWLTLAKRINTLLASPQVDGIVVTHGTDTMEETAYFLNLTVKSAKPVVLVGAMRPATAMSPDGPMNLYNAVLLAQSQEATGKGVLVSLNDTINSSREVTKTNTALQDSFKAPELGYLGYIQSGRPYFYRLSTRKHTVKTEFDVTDLTALPRVDIIYGHVDSDGVLPAAAVAAGAQGLVYAGVGNGGMSQTMRDALLAIADSGIAVVCSTRVSSGVVTLSAVAGYGCGKFIAADTLNPQKARILLCLALTKTHNQAEIQRMFGEY